MRKRNLQFYLYRTVEGRRFCVVGATILEGHRSAGFAAPGSTYAGLSGSMPGVYQHALDARGLPPARADRCPECGADEATGCYCALSSRR